MGNISFIQATIYDYFECECLRFKDENFKLPNKNIIIINLEIDENKYNFFP